MKRRRNQRKTDYKLRLGLLKSEKPRIVIRRTNKYIIIQYVVSEESKDKIIFGVNSKALLKYGWKEDGKLKSVSAAYLTGYLFGRRIKDRELDDKVIIDLGLERNIIKSRVYSAIKGLVDAGIPVKFNSEVDDKKIKAQGEKINLIEIKRKIEHETK